MLNGESHGGLTDVAATTEMGSWLRQHWMPAVRSAALIAGGAPRRLRLLGESFVAFRAADGRVAVLDEACPHRCASLVLARNEDGALRCIFHGWKIGVDGRVLEIPNETAERSESLVARIKVRTLPVREAAGLLWVLPDPNSPAPFPNFEFNELPESHTHVRAGRVRCHWLQVLESVLDAAHIGYLHRDTVLRASTAAARVNAGLWVRQAAPELEIDATPYGFREAALRALPSGRVSARIREVVAPWYVFLPADPGSDRQVVMTVPEDSGHSTQFILQYRPDRPLTEREVESLWAGAAADSDDFAADMPRADDNWGQDRAAMDAGHFSGFTDLQVFCEDFAVLESMGPVTPRAREHLTRSDASLIFFRQQLSKAARTFASGGVAPGLGNQAIDYARIRTLTAELDQGSDWRSAISQPRPRGQAE